MSRPCEVLSYCGRYLPKEGCSAGIIHRHGGHRVTDFQLNVRCKQGGATGGRRAYQVHAPRRLQLLGMLQTQMVLNKDGDDLCNLLRGL